FGEWLRRRIYLRNEEREERTHNMCCVTDGEARRSNRRGRRSTVNGAVPSRQPPNGAKLFWRGRGLVCLPPHYPRQRARQRAYRRLSPTASGRGTERSGVKCSGLKRTESGVWRSCGGSLGGWR